MNHSEALDGYTGDTIVSGPVHTRSLPGLSIRKLSVGELANNVYLLRCAETGEVLVIDAAAEHDRLVEELRGEVVARIVTTHRHYDHWQALRQLVRTTGARTVAHSLDMPELPCVTDEPVSDGDVVTVGTCQLKAIHLRGHTPGSIALLYDAGGELAEVPHLFTGDSLFPGGPGRTTSPADFASLISDLEAKVFDRLPDATWVYPGHGPDTTLGRERPHLGEWRRRGW
jgi:glyoxylase-like metal-dependent hydrolase (beta-lactamase superfamily II)